MRVKVSVAAICVLGALSGCASISEEACRAGDWDGVGFRDGVEGRLPSYFLNHARACNEIGIAPNKSVWEKGYAEGLTRYCTPRRAFEEGQSGDRLNNVCPAQDVQDLRRANERGLRWYRIDRDIQENESRIHSINHALSELADGDPSRSHLVRERSILRLETVRLRSRQSLIWY